MGADAHESTTGDGRDDRQLKPIGLGELIRFLIVTLVKWAQTGQWGEIRITVRQGQIRTVQESLSYQGSVPKRQSFGQGSPVDAIADRAAQDVTAAVHPLRSVPRGTP